MDRKDISKIEHEKELVRQALSDSEFFAEIYDHYYPRVYNYLRLRVANSQIADDLASQVFEKALSKLGSYSSEKGSFSVWLFTIAANTLKDYYRTQKRGIFHPTEVIEEMAAVLEPGIEEKVFWDETKGQLLNALKQLSIREQNLIALKFWGDLNNRQIARMMNLSENHVAVILFRAIKRLREILTESGVDIR